MLKGVSLEPTVGVPALFAVDTILAPGWSNGITPVDSECTPRFHPACTGTGLSAV
jgi:hypothetical protein